MSRRHYQQAQNVDNFLGDRSSTRLHNPPGGASTSMASLLSGGYGSDEPVKPTRRGSSNNNNSNSSMKEEFPENVPVAVKNYTNVPEQRPPETRHTSSNMFASGSAQNTGNVLTDRRTTRVHAPPGGKSSFTLG